MFDKIQKQNVFMLECDYVEESYIKCLKKLRQFRKSLNKKKIKKEENFILIGLRIKQKKQRTNKTKNIFIEIQLNIL